MKFVMQHSIESLDYWSNLHKDAHPILSPHPYMCPRSCFRLIPSYYNRLYSKDCFSHMYIKQDTKQHSTNLHDYLHRLINCIYALDFFHRKDYTRHYIEQQHHLHNLWSVLIDFMLNGRVSRLFIKVGPFDPLMLGFFLCTTCTNK
jgi:hypothetical protein